MYPGMVECTAALRALDAADGLVEFECVGAEIGGVECWLAVAGAVFFGCRCLFFWLQVPQNIGTSQT